jgi:pathogenesis-related protein 1
MKKKTLGLLSVALSSHLYGGFNFGTNNEGCDGGNGSFQQKIEDYQGNYENTVTVGTIPKDLQDIYISLQSDEDVDIRLYDADGTKIVHWPYGILNGDTKKSTEYNGVTIEYSGYNGDGTGQGHEYIKITGTTQNDFIMKAFGYRAGYAEVDYSWEGKANCTEDSSSTPSPSGSGDFEQEIIEDDIVTIGDIPPNVNNLYITLQSDKDLDIQLYDKDDGTAIVKWADNEEDAGLLNGDSKESVKYKDMEIEWSGYNGDDISKGNEYIKITGLTTCNLTMKAYGYEGGYANVHYEWGSDENETEPTTDETSTDNTTDSTATDTTEVNSTSSNTSTDDDIGDVEKSIIDRHNYYRNLDFQDSNLTWDTTLADHAQQWADYLANNYTQADADAGQSPHASQFNSSTHGLPYEGEGENVAWASANLNYVLDNPVDISVENSAGNIDGKFGAVDMWANEKAYYDYESNSGNGKVTGHYTQVVWQKSLKVGCGEAKSTTDYPGSHIVCRYSPAGNMGDEKPYCTEYSVGQYYNNPNANFTSDIINGKTFTAIKMIEDRVNCTITEETTKTVEFNSDGSGTFKAWDFFSNGGYVVDFEFTSVIEDGVLKMSGNVGDKSSFINLKMIGEDDNNYYTEVEWSLDKDNLGYYRRAILKLAK